MTYTLDSFARACRDILSKADDPQGREQVAALLRDALKDPQFVAAQFSDAPPERRLLYEDPELGFCILAHEYRGEKSSSPHDHAHSWAIYGQAAGETRMTDYSLVEPATPERPGQVRAVRTYALAPGDAHVYNEGDLHAPSRTGPTRLIRIEGTNMDRVVRAKYECVG
ncbi:MAG TPA: hypothetical protein VHA82_09550 [Ramlibacter sp.]|uniref:hypothetical protein n=1 Tax=Ramlibacter sp. TaxID=1917967 RepID=UPI002C1D430C|nr:hypothetical protein [Ramlibacter sp.]HVZ44044.1 hypothetical protein [Ramlibacter sp.]